jgi:hypothetical protein
LQIPYLITGSVAATAYGEPRLTNDIDVVVDLDEAHACPFAAQFPLGEYYLNEAIQEALIRKGQFNIIHPASGLKIEVMIQRERRSNRAGSGEQGLIHPADSYEARFAAPEDVVTKKMECYREGGSEKHLRDIAGIMKISAGEIDERYIGEWADRLGLRAVWDAMLQRLRPGN